MDYIPSGRKAGGLLTGWVGTVAFVWVFLWLVKG